MLSHLTRSLFRPIDIAWLIYFRIGVGLLLALEHTGGLVIGRVDNYTAPRFHFRYVGWEWLPVPSPIFIYALYTIILVAGLAVAVGWHFRFMAFLLSAGYTALMLLEETEYINHFYLYALVAALLACLPAHQAASADVAAGRVPAVASTPAWTRFALLAQVSLVYMFAALAKLNPDWLAARPLSVWLAAKAAYPLIGSLLAAPSTAWLMSYGGLLFDALIVPLLLFRRTRPWAFILALIFHLTNVVVFGLGTFPWFSLLITSLFFAPDFPRHLPGAAGRWFRQRIPQFTETAPAVQPVGPRAFPKHLGIVTALVVYFVIQMLLPLRHFLYPGDVHWTEQGHRFSWHLMLRAKSGSATFRVRFADGHEELVFPGTYLTRNQTNKLTHSPDLLLQFAHLLAQDHEKHGRKPTAIYCDSWVSLNGHRAQPLVSPTLNLLAQHRSLKPYPWIAPAPSTN